MGYVETEDGKPIDGFVASEIRRHARAIWVQLGIGNKAPSKWSDAGAATLRHYREEMRNRYPVLALCEMDWKADLIATDNYPSWYSHFTKKCVKEEPQEATVGVSGASSVKRRLDLPLDQMNKRVKAAGTDADIISKATSIEGAKADVGVVNDVATSVSFVGNPGGIEGLVGTRISSNSVPKPSFKVCFCSFSEIL